MPVFQRVKIERFKEILLNQPAGLVSDGGFSTYTIDDPSITPIGTGDFLGVIKTAVLLAEVYEDTMDTRNMSLAQFNNLTQQQFDDAVRQGTILLNRNNNFQSRRIGWVEIGRTRASFYYETCDNSSKRPVSEHYYDLSQIQFDNKIVLGEGSEVEPTVALSQIGNFDPNWTNNTGIFGPGFNPIPLSEYVKFAAFNNGMIQNVMGDTRQINPLGLTDDSRPIRVNLLMATRTDHFDNQYATEITPGKWGMIRSTIEEGFRPGIHVVYNQLGLGVNQQQSAVYNQVASGQSSTIDFSVNFGGCLSLGYTISTGGGTVRTGGRTTTTTPETGGPTPPPDVISDSDITNDFIFKHPVSSTTSNILKDIASGSYNRDVKVSRDFVENPCINFIHDFPKSLKKNLLFAPAAGISLGQINGAIAESVSEGMATEMDRNLLDFGSKGARSTWQLHEIFAGRIPFTTSDIPDIMDTINVPRGTLRREINPDNGCMELTYIGTPMLDYVGPKIVTPADIDFTRGDEPLFDEVDQLDIISPGYGQFQGTNPILLQTKAWYRDLFRFGLKGVGLDRSSTDTRVYNQQLGQNVTENEVLYPVYFHASDQLWQNGVAKTKSIRLSNRGMSRLIITDYSPRGNANFRNVGLIDALPIVLNPDEYVEIDIDYVPVKQGLQPWKGKSDPYPALLTREYPLPYIKMEFEVWTRVKGLGYVRIQDILTSPGTGVFKFKKSAGESGLDRPSLTRRSTPLEIKNRNKVYSILAVDVPEGTQPE